MIDLDEMERVVRASMDDDNKEWRRAALEFSQIPALYQIIENLIYEMREMRETMKKI